MRAVVSRYPWVTHRPYSNFCAIGESDAATSSTRAVDSAIIDSAGMAHTRGAFKCKRADFYTEYATTGVPVADRLFPPITQALPYIFLWRRTFLYCGRPHAFTMGRVDKTPGWDA